MVLYILKNPKGKKYSFILAYTKLSFWDFKLSRWMDTLRFSWVISPVNVDLTSSVAETALYESRSETELELLAHAHFKLLLLRILCWFLTKPHSPAVFQDITITVGRTIEQLLHRNNNRINNIKRSLLLRNNDATHACLLGITLQRDRGRRINKICFNHAGK
jgi:hypothetical protein